MSRVDHKAIVSDEKLGQFLSAIKVLIFDGSNSSKNMIATVLKEMGMPIRNILSAKSYESAREIIKTEKPQMCVSEYEVRGRYGLELLYELKEIVPEPIFVLATSTASETSVAEAAEEDVDAYIVKPFMAEQLRHYLRQAVEYRIDPPPYIAKIKQGKKAFDSNNIEEAKRFFFEASTIGEKPSLALFYLGQLNEREKQLELALDLYETGLEHMPIHYKCMTAKFQAFDTLKRPEEAYNVVKEILKHYPVTPQRLGRMIYLAMITRHFTDVEQYYDIYQKLENRTEKLQVIVRAALFTTGKYLLQEKQYQRAVSLFEKSVLCSKRDLQMILKSIEELLKVNQAGGAEHILNLISQDDLERPEAKQAEYRLVVHNADRNAAIRMGIDMIENNEADLYVFDTVIHFLKLDGSERIAEKYIEMKAKAFPAKNESV